MTPKEKYHSLVKLASNWDMPIEWMSRSANKPSSKCFRTWILLHLLYTALSSGLVRLAPIQNKGKTIKAENTSRRKLHQRFEGFSSCEIMENGQLRQRRRNSDAQHDDLVWKLLLRPTFLIAITVMYLIPNNQRFRMSPIPLSRYREDEVQRLVYYFLINKVRESNSKFFLAIHSQPRKRPSTSARGSNS